MNELPVMNSASYVSNTLGGQNLLAQAMQQAVNNKFDVYAAAAHAAKPAQVAPQPKENIMSTRRLVQVFIADPDENIPLADCLLYTGEQKITDLTDQELFFDIDIRTILEEHNKRRIALVNKAVKERVEQLEPARIRDLKMTVVTIAQF